MARPLTTISQLVGDNREKYNKLADRIHNEILVGFPAEILSFDETEQTVCVRPLIRRKIKDKRGSLQEIEITPIPDVPVAIYKGGGFAVTLPISEGDECYLCFSDVDFSAWFQNGGVQNQEHFFKHCLGSAIAIVGLSSLPNVIPNYNPKALEVRNYTQTVKISLSDDEMTMIAPKIKMQADEIDMQATSIKQVASKINIGGNTTIDGKSFLPHAHEKGQDGLPTGGVI